MTVKVLEFKREDWRDAAKTLRKIADDLDAGEHPECTVGALTLIGALLMVSPVFSSLIRGLMSNTAARAPSTDTSICSPGATIIE